MIFLRLFLKDFKTRFIHEEVFGYSHDIFTIISIKRDDFSQDEAKDSLFLISNF